MARHCKMLWIDYKMYFQDAEYNLPHFHVIYGEYSGIFNIDTI